MSDQFRNNRCFWGNLQQVNTSDAQEDAKAKLLEFSQSETEQCYMNRTQYRSLRQNIPENLPKNTKSIQNTRKIYTSEVNMRVKKTAYFSFKSQKPEPYTCKDFNKQSLQAIQYMAIGCTKMPLLTKRSPQKKQLIKTEEKRLYTQVETEQNNEFSMNKKRNLRLRKMYQVTQNKINKTIGSKLQQISQQKIDLSALQLHECKSQEKTFVGLNAFPTKRKMFKSRK